MTNGVFHAETMLQHWIAAAISPPVEMADLFQRIYKRPVTISQDYYLDTAAHLLVTEYDPDTRYTALDNLTVPDEADWSQDWPATFRTLRDTIRDRIDRTTASAQPDIAQYVHLTKEEHS